MQAALYNAPKPLASSTDPLARWSDRFIYQRCIVASEAPSTTKYVLLVMSLFMDKNGKNCDLAYSRTADLCGLHEDTVKDHVKRARKGGLLKVEVGKGWKSIFGRTNRYHAANPPGAVDALRERVNSANLHQERQKQGYIEAARAINRRAGLVVGGS
jgi:hypothetical protein